MFRIVLAVAIFTMMVGVACAYQTDALPELESEASSGSESDVTVASSTSTVTVTTPTATAVPPTPTSVDDSRVAGDYAPDFAWDRAVNLIGKGEYFPYVQHGEIRLCDQLRHLADLCLFTEDSGQVVEFAYGDEAAYYGYTKADSSNPERYTYYVYYDLTDLEHRGESWRLITSTLFPLTLEGCGEVHSSTTVTVLIATPQGLDNICNNRR